MAKTSKSRMSKRQQSKYSPSKLPNASNRRAYVKKVLESAKSKVSIPVTSKGRLVEESLDKWTTKIAEKKKYRRSARLTHNTNLDKKINALISDPSVINASESSKILYYNQLYPVKLSRILREEFDKTEQFRLSPKGTKMVMFLEENRPNQKVTYGWEGPLYKEIIELIDTKYSLNLVAVEE